MQVVQPVVTQRVTVVEDFQVGYVDRVVFVCVHQVVQNQQQNVSSVKTVRTVDVRCSTADVLTVLH